MVDEQDGPGSDPFKAPLVDGIHAWKHGWMHVLVCPQCMSVVGHGLANVEGKPDKPTWSWAENACRPKRLCWKCGRDSRPGGDQEHWKLMLLVARCVNPSRVWLPWTWFNTPKWQLQDFWKAEQLSRLWDSPTADSAD